MLTRTLRSRYIVCVFLGASILTIIVIGVLLFLAALCVLDEVLMDPNPQRTPSSHPAGTLEPHRSY